MSKFLRLKVHRLSLILTLLLSTIGCDQATKAVARDTLSRSGYLSYLGDFFRLEYTENPGAFLGLGGGLSATFRLWFFCGVISVFLFFLARAIFKGRQDPISTIGMTLLLGGGVGNVIDRLTQDGWRRAHDLGGSTVGRPAPC